MYDGGGEDNIKEFLYIIQEHYCKDIIGKMWLY
jgi:hypothetical protein